MLPGLEDGWLPAGRHRTDLASIEDRFVLDDAFSTSISRAVIWDEFQTATELLCRSAIVHAAWISGSFVSDKLNPRDVDVVYVVNSADRYARSHEDRQIIEMLQAKSYDPLTHSMKPTSGLKVDAFILDWAPYHGDPQADESYGKYTRNRGYWDDFWQRRRSGGKKDPAVPQDTHPRRGYLEVAFDDYI